MYNFPVDIIFTSAKSSINDKNTDRFVVTGNGIDIPEVIKNTKSTKKVNILSIARFDPIKGIPNLLNAFNKLLNDVPEAHLTLVGHGPEEQKIKKEIRNLKIEKKVTIKKLFKQDALYEYEDAKVFVLPSLSEGFPLVVLEAMAYKVPIVATKVGDIPEILENGRLGELVEKNDSDALYLAIKKVITRKNTRTLNAAYFKVKKYYNWNQVASKIYAEYIKENNQ
jgi:glycosyltransferase involved in cell wall biosynthesis